MPDPTPESPPARCREPWWASFLALVGAVIGGGMIGFALALLAVME